MLAHPAWGQDDDTQRTDEGLNEIVVTARFVEENLQDTPIAITAQSEEQLEAANVTNIGTLGAVIPNLQTVPGDSQSAGTPRISLRGVQQGGSSSRAVPPAVAIYTDDIYHGTTAGSELDFTDVARVEVNRGPQSTLSGNASIAGSIKLYTVDPRGDGSGFFSLSYGSRDHIEGAGAIDIGLSSTLSMRLSGHFDKQTGYGNRLDFTCMMDRLGTPELAGTLPYFQPDSAKKDCIIGHTGGGTFAVGQAKLRWQPTEDVDLILTARHRKEDMEETPEVVLSFTEPCVTGLLGPQPCGTAAGNQAVIRATYKTFGVVADNRFVTSERNGGIYDTYATNCRPLFDISGGGFPSDYPMGFCYEPRKSAHHTLLSGKLQARLSDDVNMTAIGGYTDYANEFTQQSDQSPLGVTISHFQNEDQQWTGELRFDGSLLDDRLQWVVGAFALRMEGYQNNMLSFQNVFQLSKVKGINNSKSGFFHLDYNLTDPWRVSGGARYTDSEILITIDNPNAISVLDPARSPQKRWDWLISTDYKITEDVMVYASAASGSRPPGLATIVVTQRQLLPTSAEDLINYEAGIKADLFDRRFRTNLTAFYMDYRKLANSVRGFECRNQPGPVATWFPVASACSDPANGFPQPPDQVTFWNNSAIPAEVKGFEWEITAIPIDGLRIDWIGGYNKFTSGIKTPGEPGYYWPGNLRQPEWNMHANISYDLETDAGTFTPRLDWNWQSRQTWDRAPQLGPPQSDLVIDPYGLWNAQIAYTSLEGDWSAVFQVTNLADKWYHYEVLKTTFNQQTRVGAPREWKLTLRKDF